MTGRTRVVFSVADGGGIAVQLGLFLLANVQQQASVYYLHRLMHVPPLYKWIHKQHHLYTAPEVGKTLALHRRSIGHGVTLWSGFFGVSVPTALR
mgnify:CR=1 FL=1